MELDIVTTTSLVIGLVLGIVGYSSVELARLSAAAKRQQSS